MSAAEAFEITAKALFGSRYGDYFCNHGGAELAGLIKPKPTDGYDWLISEKEKMILQECFPSDGNVFEEALIYIRPSSNATSALWRRTILRQAIRWIVVKNEKNTFQTPSEKEYRLLMDKLLKLAKDHRIKHE